MPASARSPRHYLWYVVGLAAVAAASLPWASRLWRGPHANSTGLAPRVVDWSTYERLERLKREAIAHIENGEPLAAEPLWDELERELPEEPLIARNRLVSRVLAAEAERTTDAYQRATEALERAARLEPASPVPAWLQGRLLAAGIAGDDVPADDAARLAAESFSRAAKLAAPHPGPWFDWRMAAKLGRDEGLESDGRRAIQEAYRLAPENVFIALEQLAALAEVEDAELVPVAQQLAATLAPLRAGILRRTKTDVQTLLDEAQSAATEGRWPAAQLAVRRLGFIRSEDVAQSDRRKVQPHPLEFLLHDFATISSATVPDAVADETAIQFVPADQPLPLENLSDVRDLQVADIDVDGELDLVILQGRFLNSYLRRGGEWSRGPTLDLPIEVSRIAAADLDRDDKEATAAAVPAASSPGAAAENSSASFFLADCDLVLYGPGGILLVRNAYDRVSGRRTWEIVEQAADLPAREATLAAALADVDHDGDLDLVLGGDFGLRVWTNRGNMVFDDASAGFSLPTTLRITDLAAVDWDRDVDIDLVAMGPDGRDCGWLENLRHLQFRWNSFDSSFNSLAPDALRALKIVDLDGDASWDVAHVDKEGLSVSWTQTALPGSVKFTRAESLALAAGDRLLMEDFDNDGYQDAITWNRESLHFARGAAQSLSMKDGIVAPPSDSTIVACDAADLDQDGDLDLLVALSDRVVTYRNEGGNSRPWLDVRVRGADEEKSGRVNHYAIGSVVELRHGHRYQAQLVTRPSQHFGLGRQTSADLLRVIFTNGIPQSVLRPPTNQTVLEPQRLIGSCPYLYAWNGARFEFVTDLLWAAPLGLQVAEGQLMPDRPWEYLKIEGEQLQARDGRYQLRITEELWEAAYFDLVELVAIDHPAEIDIYTNEKVGPPQLALPRIHTVSRRHPLRFARDSQGRDWTRELAARDESYAQGFVRPLSQGVTPPHFLELDLGELNASRQVTLFLTGWIYPTDTSLNIGRGQNPARSAPLPPRLLASNAAGEWDVLQPFMGFPGGKTKTIAVEIPAASAPLNGRLRIESSAEIRWDEIFYTVDESPQAVRQTTLPLRSAHLRYRGFSRPRPRSPSEPERYDYDDCETSAAWPPMAGRFTRYGDVRELVASWDDRLAVFGAGDELALEFDALPPPPRGWKRDFVLHNVGWDKDCVLNTVHGQTVEPMPFRGMPSYPYPVDAAPHDHETNEYLRTFQTREQPPRRFQRTLFPTSGEDTLSRD